MTNTTRYVVCSFLGNTIICFNIVVSTWDSHICCSKCRRVISEILYSGYIQSNIGKRSAIIPCRQQQQCQVNHDNKNALYQLKKNKKQAQHRAAAETATRKLIGHFKRSMYFFFFYRHYNCQIWSKGDRIAVNSQERLLSIMVIISKASTQSFLLVKHINVKLCYNW